jgi:hypothetical protein
MENTTWRWLGPLLALLLCLAALLLAAANGLVGASSLDQQQADVVAPSRPLAFTSPLYFPIIVTESPPPTRTPTATPTHPPMPGYNVMCQSFGSTQACASVSEPYPAPYTNVWSYAKLMVNGVAQTHEMASFMWYFTANAAFCVANTDPSGIASCKKNVPGISVGQTVTVAVAIAGMHVSTWLNPQ